MTAVLHRLVALLVMFIVSGLPVAGVLCARDCVAGTATATEGHCHESDSTGDTRLSAADSTDCIPLAQLEAGPIERSGSKAGSAPVVFADLENRFALRLLSAAHRVSWTIVSRTSHLSPGTNIPLRI